MWISILHDCKREYYLKYKKTNSDFRFYLTNFINIWEKKFSTTELLDLIQNNNPHLEGDDTQLISVCLEILFNNLSQNDGDTTIHCEEENENEIIFNFKTVGKFPFKIKFEFKISSPAIFYEEVTVSLIQVIKELKRSETCLFECLKKKDVEIQDYKAEGACISLKHLETKLFNQHEHQQMFTPSNNRYFNCEDLFSITNAKNIQESTPKHLDAQELKEKSPIKSCVSSPTLKTGIAPVSTQSDEDNDDDKPDESVLRLGKRKKKIRKQLNL